MRRKERKEKRNGCLRPYNELLKNAVTGLEDEGCRKSRFEVRVQRPTRTEEYILSLKCC